MQGQIVTISFFRFAGFKQKYWAFKMMQLAHAQIGDQASGLSFYKLLGSGGEDGFSWKPNFGVYGLLCVWDDIGNAEHFLHHSPIFAEYAERASEHFTTYMQTLKSHGVWSGVRPFVETGTSADGHVAVVTRATIKPIKLAYFWSKVAGVSKSIELYKGKRFSVGIGEWPLIQQATFSIWDNHEAMTDYAYKNPMHQKVIKLTRAKGWYKEELFARFKPFQIEGVWDGRSVDFLN
jgi:hypothetical protein